jgi:hypothetical protein
MKKLRILLLIAPMFFLLYDSIQRNVEVNKVTQELSEDYQLHLLETEYLYLFDLKNILVGYNQIEPKNMKKENYFVQSMIKNASEKSNLIVYEKKMERILGGTLVIFSYDLSGESKVTIKSLPSTIVLFLVFSSYFLMIFFLWNKRRQS